MRLRDQAAQVQAEPHAAGGALARRVGAVEGFGRAGPAGLGHPRAMVAHRQATTRRPRGRVATRGGAAASPPWRSALSSRLRSSSRIAHAVELERRQAAQPDRSRCRGRRTGSSINIADQRVQVRRPRSAARRGRRPGARFRAGRRSGRASRPGRAAARRGPLPSSTSSAFSRARVSGERSSWLIASSSCALGVEPLLQAAAMALICVASSPSSSLRRGAIGCEKSPAPKRTAPARMSSSGRSRRRTTA